MRTTASIIAALTLSLSLAAQTSNVQTVKAWTRTHVMGLPGGGLYDPTGTIAAGQRLAAVQATLDQSSNIIAAASSGLTNALVRLYEAASRTNEFTGRLYLAADMDSDPGYHNVKGYIIREVAETNGATHYFVHYTRELDVPPATVWQHDLGDGGIYYASGSVATNNVTTNILGYACYDITVRRPAAAAYSVLRTHRFLRFGAPEIPLYVSGLRLIAAGATNSPFTGSVTVTNAASGATNEIIKAYLSGFLQSVTTNAIGGT